MWTPGLEPGRRVLQTRALPLELNPRRHSRHQRNLNPLLPVDNRALYRMSYGGNVFVGSALADRLFEGG